MMVSSKSYIYVVIIDDHNKNRNNKHSDNNSSDNSNNENNYGKLKW